MIFKATTWAIFACLIIPWAGVGFAADPSSDMHLEIKDVMRSVEGVKRLPVTGLSMVKAGDKQFLITDNGHFVVAGNYKLVDMWQGKVLSSIDDASGVDKVDLRKVGIDPNELAIFTIGSGAREVTLFVDPKCPYCHDLLSQLDGLGKDYAFKIVLIPALGKDSADVIKQLVCDKDKAAALKALVDQNFTQLPAVPKDNSCDLKPLQKAVVTTKLLDIQGVPYLFLPSKHVHRGGAKSLKALLDKDLAYEINR